jgi:hypothetical protein
MKIAALTLWIGLVLAAPVAAQGAQGAPGGGSKASLSEVRTTVHELEGHTDKLRELLDQYRALVEQRPTPQGSGPEGKKAHEEQLAKWNAAIERLLVRIDAARGAVVDTMQRLDKAATGELPTGLAKDVARAHNEADAERATAEQVLAKSKSTSKSKPAKAAKPAPEKAEPELPADLDL